jgi:drug/metabolite transporter (DMT)-like permease
VTFTAILFGIASALTWGAGDFAGGIASKRSSPYAVVIWGDIVGMTVVSVLAWAMGDPLPSWGSVVYILLSSFSGAIGIIILYRALAGGQMSIAAPVSALMAAVIPVFVGVIVDGWPKWLTMVGVVMALVAIWLVARTEHEGVHRIHWADVRMPLLAGVLFGLFFIFMHKASSESVLWPAVFLRVSSAALLAVIALFTRSSFAIPRTQWWLIVFVGIFDIAGNIFYVLSAQTGRMDIAAVVGSLYPGATVVLADFRLKVRVSGWQRVGVLAALVAIVMITI